MSETIRVTHCFTESEIDDLIKELVDYSIRTGITRLSKICGNYRLFITYTRLNNIVSIDIFPISNEWFIYRSSLECELKYLKERLLNIPYLELHMCNKNSEINTITLNTDLWSQQEADKKIEQHNSNPVVSEALKITDKEKQIIEATRNIIVTGN